MEDVFINGLKLPSLLVEMVEDGRWKRPENIEKLSQLTGVARPMEFNFESFEGMARETEGARNLASDEETSAIYNLYSSKEHPSYKKNEGALDVDLAVLIIVNWDEEAVFLDYRPDKNEPSVRLAYWSTENNAQNHRLLANNFASFAAKIGLQMDSA
jgi:hypothetical protein